MEISTAVSNDTQVIDKGNLVEYTAGEPGKIKSEFFPLVRYRCSSGNFSRGAVFLSLKSTGAPVLLAKLHFKAIVGAKINRSAQCQVLPPKLLPADLTILPTLALVLMPED